MIPFYRRLASLISARDREAPPLLGKRLSTSTTFMFPTLERRIPPSCIIITFNATVLEWNKAYAPIPTVWCDDLESSFSLMINEDFIPFSQVQHRFLSISWLWSPALSGFFHRFLNFDYSYYIIKQQKNHNF